MTVSLLISPKDLSQVFGLPAPCNICPQYGHRIVFSRKCYYETQCPLPVLIHKMKTRARKTGVVCIDPQGTDEIKQWKTPLGSEEPVPSAGQKTLPVLDSQTTYHNARTADHLAAVDEATQDFPQVLDEPFPSRRPAPNLFKRFVSWAWSKSAFNDPTKERVNGTWRRRQ